LNCFPLHEKIKKKKKTKAIFNRVANDFTTTFGIIPRNLGRSSLDQEGLARDDTNNINVTTNTIVTSTSLNSFTANLFANASSTNPFVAVNPIPITNAPVNTAANGHGVNNIKLDLNEKKASENNDKCGGTLLRSNGRHINTLMKIG
jgi:hypothetical protein